MLWLIPWASGACSVLIAVAIDQTIYVVPGPGILYWIGGLVVAIFASFRVANRFATKLGFAVGAIVLSAAQILFIGYYIARPYME
ncbi:hypothetical protein CKO51_03515 [Rhodopirellula sp. SM50]|nr:hypothetical protein CKO51_03515 [Rhodopirellula sp. SM50]